MPIDPLRLGALSARTTHPFYIARWNDALHGLGLNGRIENPYRDRTKGEMVVACANGALLCRLAPSSLSKDGERGSYPEIVDALAQHGAQGKTDAHALYRRVVFNVLISNVDDHLRNHGFLWLGKAGWSLSPAYDLNPVPTDLKAWVLTTNIDLDEGTCSLELLEAASEFFALTLSQARTVIKEVAVVTAIWRDIAKVVGARSAEINRMASAFEHDDLKRALAL